MIARRRIPSMACVSRKSPSSSGPRWVIAAFMACPTASPGSGAPGAATIPMIPHISQLLRFGRDSGFIDVLPQPKFQDEKTPEAVRVVPRASNVVVEESLDARGLAPAACGRTPVEQRIAHGGLERAIGAQP